MDYSITYWQDGRQEHKKKNVNLGRIALLSGALLLAGMMLIPQMRLAVRDALLPGDGEVTAKAMEAFVSDVRSGASLEDAVEAFCLTVLHND